MTQCHISPILFSFAVLLSWNKNYRETLAGSIQHAHATMRQDSRLLSHDANS